MLAIVGVGAVAAVVATGPDLGGPVLRLPDLAVPPAGAFLPGLVLRAIPQLPLMFGNAVVAVSDVADNSFGERAVRVRPLRVCRVSGLGNVASALVGGAPMCHGAGGSPRTFGWGPGPPG